MRMELTHLCRYVYVRYPALCSLVSQLKSGCRLLTYENLDVCFHRVYGPGGSSDADSLDPASVSGGTLTQHDDHSDPEPDSESDHRRARSAVQAQAHAQLKVSSAVGQSGPSPLIAASSVSGPVASRTRSGASAASSACTGGSLNTASTGAHQLTDTKPDLSHAQRPIHSRTAEPSRRRASIRRSMTLQLDSPSSSGAQSQTRAAAAAVTHTPTPTAAGVAVAPSDSRLVSHRRRSASATVTVTVPVSAPEQSLHSHRAKPNETKRKRETNTTARATDTPSIPSDRHTREDQSVAHATTATTGTSIVDCAHGDGLVDSSVAGSVTVSVTPAPPALTPAAVTRTRPTTGAGLTPHTRRHAMTTTPTPTPTIASSASASSASSSSAPPPLPLSAAASVALVSGGVYPPHPLNPFRQMSINIPKHDRIFTSWATNLGHHFFLWEKK